MFVAALRLALSVGVAGQRETALSSAEEAPTKEPEGWAVTVVLVLAHDPNCVHVKINATRLQETRQITNSSVCVQRSERSRSSH